ncbi:MAG: primosomal protein N' [Bacteroidales bacterium]|nr:primosomal protein N' [Bacteroidales bacterium]
MEGQFVFYVSVILPIKWDGEIFYGVTSACARADTGSWVSVDFGKRSLQGVVRRRLEWKELPYQSRSIDIKSLGGVVDRPSVSATEIRFWDLIAKYYLCSTGEVFKAAYPILSVRQQEVASHRKPEDALKAIDGKSEDIELSPAQQTAFEQIKEKLPEKTVLLEGVTGSGKTEIYIKLIDEYLSKGKDVLYLVPEIAMGNYLHQRLKKHYGERLMCFHSSVTQATKKLIREVLTFKGTEECPRKPVVVLGTRSSVFLPFERLGLVVIDEEHDSSFKQEDPSPRYNGRDAALFLAQMLGAKVLMGSATPSFESLYNCYTRKFAKVTLAEKFFKSPPPEVIVIDTIWTRKSRQMKGSFSQQLINLIAKTVAGKKQVLVFRNIRSYAPVVQCSNCGEPVKCPHCNVPLSYHRYDNTLRCHWCEYKAPYNPVCPSCKEQALELRGAGTEKIEEELKELFPNAAVARYDADIAKSKKESEKVLSDFASGKTDILVGTQMTSKGFDFENLALVAVIQADTILAQQDFRADEKAMQLFIQLLGRSGRRTERGSLVIQTNQKNHPVIKEVVSMSERLSWEYETGAQDAANSFERSDGGMMAERSMYCFPPFVRLVNVILRDKNFHKLETAATSLSSVLKSSRAFSATEVSGPFPPRMEKLRDEYQLCFSVKFAKDASLAKNKDALKKVIDLVKLPVQATIDVDPN